MILKSDKIINLQMKVKKNIGCGNAAGRRFYVSPNLSQKISIIPLIPSGTLINTIAAARQVCRVKDRYVLLVLEVRVSQLFLGFIIEMLIYVYISIILNAAMSILLDVILNGCYLLSYLDEPHYIYFLYNILIQSIDITFHGLTNNFF